MDLEQPVVFKKEKIRWSVEKRRAILGSILIGSVFALGTLASWQYWERIFSADIATVTEFGLDETSIVEENIPPIYGQLFFSAIANDDTTQAPYIYRYDFSESFINRHFDFPALSYAKSTETLDTMIIYTPDDTDPDGLQTIWRDNKTGTAGPLPHLVGYSEMELTISPDDTHYAYSLMAKNDVSATDLDQWFIAVHNYKTGWKTIIPSAMEPHFTADGALMYYMKKDGIYRYDLALATSSLVTNIYQNLTPIDDYSVSESGNTIIFTSPSLRVISVQQLEPNGRVVERGVHVGDGVRYRQPVINPTDEWYVVMTVKDSDYDQETGEYKKVIGEVRPMLSASVIGTIDFPYFKPESIILNGWENVMK